MSLFVSRVTAAPSAINEPTLDTPVVAVMDATAKTCPLNAVVVPKVAELPTAQITWHARAPLITTTFAAEAVVMVDPIWKTNCAFLSFWPLRVRVPVSWAEEENL